MFRAPFYPVAFIALSVTLAQADRPDLSVLDSLSETHRLSPSALARLEADLQRNPADLSMRARLLVQYYQHANGAARLQHILWTVSNRPESKLAGSPLVGVRPAPDSLSTRSDYELIKAAWLTALQHRSSEPAVLGNAGVFFAEEEPVRAAELFRRAWALDPDNRMRRAALITFYQRLLAVCEQENRCPDPALIREAAAELRALSRQ